MQELNKMEYDSFTLDNSAIIHLAALRKDHSNGFRISVTLRQKVEPKILQKTLCRIVPRFPTIAAGIKKDTFDYKILPVKYAPKIIKDKECLTVMTEQEIEKCAFRILLRDTKISGEFFHALTDGHGALVFMQSLVAMYLKLRYRVAVPDGEMIRISEESFTPDEWKDDYITYSGKKKTKLNHRSTYQLSGKLRADAKVTVTAKTYNTDMLLAAAHDYGTTLNTFLAAVMAKSVAMVQDNHSDGKRAKKPIQIMVPVNLRKMFPSHTLRNFSLFALPCIEQPSGDLPFGEYVRYMENELAKELTPEQMAAVMKTHTRLGQAKIFKIIPLSVRLFVLKIAHRIFGEKSSCISLSNYGVVDFPSELTPYIENVEFVLSPRITSPYNCGVVSFGDRCNISFSRSSEKPELERCFFRELEHLLR